MIQLSDYLPDIDGTPPSISEYSHRRETRERVESIIIFDKELENYQNSDDEIRRTNLSY